MQWSDLKGHHRQREWFANAISNERLGHAFLLVGPNGIGKRTMAKLLAKSLLCPNRSRQGLEPCGGCESCAQVDASTHPDLIEIRKPDDKSVLPIDLFVGSAEHRGREGLIHDIGLKPFHGHGKVALIDDADCFNEESSNSLLKTLEEPPPNVRIFLIGTSLQRQLPTIRSRSQVVRFQGLSNEDLLSLIQLQSKKLSGETEPMTISPTLLASAEGSLAQWSLLADPKLMEFRSNLFGRLASRPIDIVGLAKAIVASVDAVGKEGPERRMRLHTILRFSMDFFRYQLGLVSGGISPATLDPAIHSVLQSSRQVVRKSLQQPTRSILRTLEAANEIDRNVAAATLVEAWAADIAALQE